MKLLSIIVPVYNVDKYLNRCIDSIISQSYSNLEIILIDDGSTDNSGKICDEYRKKDNRIKVIHKNNGGLSDARNKGIDIASGDYIGFVDSDDYVEDTMYEILMDAIEQSSSEIACCGRFISNDNGNLASNLCLTEPRIFNSESAIREMLLGKVINEAAWDKLYKKSLFNNIRYPYGEINEDIVTTPLLLQRTNKVIHVGKPLYHYYKRENSITAAQYNEKKSVVYKHILWISDFIKNEYPNLTGYFYTYEVNVAVGMMADIKINKKTYKTFEKDYLKYKSLFDRDFNAMMHSDKVDKYIKAKALLVKTHLYLPMKKLLKKKDALMSC